ncbi:hypothetical protein VI03_25245 [Burkholderia vietnamiensis]|uniref:hypothetical protein n=1 Tax=Burkholderia vietnamiensis TaxID=60552 RepID=UPI000621BBCA|nr:hypothetical protein [Burkholderia vietnamiensis]KKI36086.1 hypothetical protein VI03_25245 [Burkholderia vietnamiensis]MBR8189154.1 hypothetical protein [Burkholderia vietnamiensis]
MRSPNRSRSIGKRGPASVRADLPGAIRAAAARATAAALYTVLLIVPGLISIQAVNLFFGVTLVMPFVGVLIYPRGSRPVPVARLAKDGATFAALLGAALLNWARFAIWPIAVACALYREVRYNKGATKALTLYVLAFGYAFLFLLIAHAIPEDVRPRVLLAFGIYLAIGMAALTIANVRMAPVPDSAAEDFLIALRVSAKRIRDTIAWPCIVLAAVRRHGKE